MKINVVGFARIMVTLTIACCLLFNIRLNGQEVALATNRQSKPSTAFRPDGAPDLQVKRYEEKATDLILKEANKVAAELKLGEKLPITKSDLNGIFIVPYDYSRLSPKMIGNIHTENYGYYVSLDNKLCFIEASHQREDTIRWIKDYQLPRTDVDTNLPFRLAMEWLTAASMDVKRLNRECSVEVELDPSVNGVNNSSHSVVPVYCVYWLSPQNRKNGYGDAASVKLFAPTKKLVSLRVYESKYILRAPLVIDPSLIKTNSNARPVIDR